MAATPRKKKPTVPRSRRLKEPSSARMRLVPFNPERANELLTLHTFDQVGESLAFWMGRLATIPCPACGHKNTLTIERLTGVLLIECSRRALESGCEFQWESSLATS